MAKKIHTFWRLLLGSLITLLGFAACKTSKKAQLGDETLELYGPPPIKVEKQKPIDMLKPLYGVPPVQVVEEPKTKIEE